jgi:hypothetical protein
MNPANSVNLLPQGLAPRKGFSWKTVVIMLAVTLLILGMIGWLWWLDLQVENAQSNLDALRRTERQLKFVEDEIAQRTQLEKDVQTAEARLMLPGVRPWGPVWDEVLRLLPPGTHLTRVTGSSTGIQVAGSVVDYPAGSELLARAHGSKTFAGPQLSILGNTASGVQFEISLPFPTPPAAADNSAAAEPPAEKGAGE